MTPEEQRAVCDRILRRGKGINARRLRMQDGAAALTPTEGYLAEFRKRTNLMIRDRIRTRGVNKALLGEVEFSLDEPAKWGAACMLAIFRNWRNRR